MEPEEEPGGAAVREVCEEAGVRGKLGRLLGIFENQDRKHRTSVYILTVTEILEDGEDAVNIGRKREWLKAEDAIKVLQCHKPVHAAYLEKLRLGCSPTNGNSMVPTLPDGNSLYVISAQTSGLPSTIEEQKNKPQHKEMETPVEEIGEKLPEDKMTVNVNELPFKVKDPHGNKS
ncbi:diphosphoinositol polyphosphate phosphohydrolase 2-like [Monodelphis domestica]|uniref:Diphosphoinositol polyphosphate phosphohydrolase 2-like n=1 Tax=Monodelphis domestica TaxID=13616 RepID=K7E122_MONDO|nr:diphosphoinositol polyphosphate phosphohydrolase 2-like [Monodelphis domestica]